LAGWELTIGVKKNRDGMMRAWRTFGPEQRQLFSRFWKAASGFWRGRSAWTAWPLTVALILIVLLQLGVQYELNLWNRNFFDALGRRNAHALWYQAALFVPLIAGSVSLAAASVWARMTAQRRWREYLTAHLILYWLARGRYRRLDYAQQGRENPEYRIAEDARLATDAPIDLAVGLLNALLMAATFISVLWTVGGNITVTVFATNVVVPGYLVVSVIVYSSFITAAMVFIGRSLTLVIQSKNQAEAELRSTANTLRTAAERATAVAGSEAAARGELWRALRGTLRRWRELAMQLVRTTLVLQTNTLLAPVVGLVLCAPKFLAGSMSLGELTQAAAAFVLVQSAFNWLVDNYQRLADWISSVDRVATLLVAVDELCARERLTPTATFPQPEPVQMRTAVTSR
jgi:vitamin B12/bleomycin/antimicrobial peptide transport system ATP-binding/permease protein